MKAKGGDRMICQLNCHLFENGFRRKHRTREMIENRDLVCVS